MSLDRENRTYTLGRPPRTTGLGGASMKVTVMLGGTFFASMVLVAINLVTVAFAVGIIGLLLTGAVFFQLGSRSLASRWQLYRQNRRKERRGEDLYVSGPDSKIPGAQFRLPGVLARTELIEATDSTGNPYAVAVDRPNNRVTVFLDAQLTGDVDRTRDERDENTADWGRFEASLSLSEDVTSCVVVISNRPGTGQLAQQEVATHLSPDAPELARNIQLEAAEMLSESAGELECHIAISYKVMGSSFKNNEFTMNLGYLIPNLIPLLSWAGIEAKPMDYNAVVARIHSFYDPSTEQLFEELRVQGEPHLMAWEDAGPSWALSTKDGYFHENCESVTWEMVAAPASTFEDRVLRPLVEPNVNIPRGRLAMFYEPIPASKGAQLVEREYKDALVGMNSSKSITKIGSTVRAEEAEQARRAVARGAQVGLRSLLYTATVGPGEDIKKTRSAVTQAAAQSNIRVQEYTSMHDAGFALTAGMGQTPQLQNTTTKLLR